MKRNSNIMERKGDLENLSIAKKTFMFESKALRLKKNDEKERLKEEWEAQIM